MALRYQTAASGTNVIYQEPQQTFPLHGQVEVYWVRRMMLCQPRGSLRAVYSLGVGRTPSLPGALQSWALTMRDLPPAYDAMSLYHTAETV